MYNNINVSFGGEERKERKKNFLSVGKNSVLFFEEDIGRG